jgi:hypothetical protein
VSLAGDVSLLDVCARLEREAQWAGSVESLRDLAAEQVPPAAVYEDEAWGPRVSEAEATLLYERVTAQQRAGEEMWGRIHAADEPRGMMHGATYAVLPGQQSPERPGVGVAYRLPG